MAALDYAQNNWELAEQLRIAKASLLRWASVDIDSFDSWLDQRASELTDAEKAGPEWQDFLRAHYSERRRAEPSGGEVARTWAELERCAALALALAPTNPTGWSSHQGVIYDPAGASSVASVWPLVNQAELSGDWSGTLDRMLKISTFNPRILAPFLHGWMNGNIDQAIAWASEIDDQAKRSTVFAAMSPWEAEQAGSTPRFCETELLNKQLASAPEAVPFLLHPKNHRVVVPMINDWLATHPIGNHDALLGGLIPRVAPHDRATALAWLDRIESTETKNAATLGILNSWTYQAPTAALAWVESFSDEELKLSATQTIAQHWGHRDRAAAIAWIEAIADQGLKEAAAQSMAEYWVFRDQPAAVAWLEKELGWSEADCRERLVNFK